jgi:spore germination protein GerM
MRTRTALLVAAILLGAGGCGIPVDDEPRAVQPPPGQYLAPASPAPQTDATGDVAETIYLTKDQTIVTVSRRVDGEPTVEQTVRDLIAGPTDPERAAGIGSALPGTAVIDGVRVLDGIAIVTLGARLEGTRNDENLAYGQIVCTLDARSDINGVAFEQGGQRISVPTGDASLSKATLTTADYEILFGHR